MRSKKNTTNSILLVISYLVVGLITNSTKSLAFIPVQPLLKQQEKQQSVKVSPQELPLPDNGHGVYNFDKNAASSYLEIIPSKGEKHLVVKVENANTGETVCWFLILKGQSYKTKIPPGKYRFKLASGIKWYGDKLLFGSSATYSKITETIEIPEMTIYSVSLIPQIFGDLNEKPISARDFLE